MDWLQAAKNMIAECDGEHPIPWVTAKALLAIADALIAIAERIEKVVDE